MAVSGSEYRLRECDSSTCTDHTEYICETCQHVRFCLQCKESHVNNLKTIDHKVVTYREKYRYNSKQENYVRHSSNVHKMYCISCNLPFCYHCTEHDNHRKLSVQKTI